jgi:GntR family transcriptional regulator
MFIRIESSSGVPITRQIADQIRLHCATGTLTPGDKLPSVRQLASEILVNQNTILRVYERLTTEGLLERRHGDGTYVADALPRGRAKLQRNLLEQELDRIAHKAIELGVEADQLRQMLDDALQRAGKQRNENGAQS